MPEHRRLVVVTNREPYEIIRDPQSGALLTQRRAGGLVAALEPAMHLTGGTWISWAPQGRNASRVTLPGWSGQPLTLRQVPVSPPEVEGYYEGFANQGLWPLCHGFIDRVLFRRRDFAHYARINERFARAALEEAGTGTPVWVHDYHLALCPGHLRALAPDLPVGLFWHIPFPAPEIFRVAPYAAEIIKGMLGADLIGFHLPQDAENFKSAARLLLEASVEDGAVYLNGHQTRVEAHPIGVDFRRLSRLASSPEVRQRAARLRRALGVEHLLLGVDRLDYTKGLPERLEALEELLARHPALRGKICLIQIAVPSRSQLPEYKEIRRRVDELVGRINGQFASGSYLPVRYLYRNFSEEELVSYYAAADLALVTPLRDGMNLVAKEYIACQPEARGALVLSSFAGAAQELTEAYQINPYDREGMVEGILWGLFDEKSHRLERMRALRARVEQKDVFFWLESFLKSFHRSAFDGQLFEKKEPKPAYPHTNRTSSDEQLLADG